MKNLETYHILSFGCQMNAYETEVMAGVLEARGLRPASGEDAADVLLINTCIVRGGAEQRAVGRIERLKPLKAAHPHRIFGVCGCLAQRDASKLLDKHPHLDIALGTRAIPRLSALLDAVLSGQGPQACVEACDEPYGTTPGAPPARKSSLRALTTIMQGCDNWCSYCIVPTVRGRERSRPLGAILGEIENLASGGCRDITLVGQNVNAWRGDANSDGSKWIEHTEAPPETPLDFADLLERVSAIPGIARVRYITSHPRDAGRRHIEAVARLPEVCDHFHLPVQSGADAVLERMNRGYTRAKYLELIHLVRERVPKATITTDLIVGFPGESDADFEATLELVEAVRFDAAFTFFYNTRSGTRAAEWKDDVLLALKKERLARLIEIQKRISFEKNQELIGAEVELLIESPARRSPKSDGAPALLGRTTGDKCVIVEGEPDVVGQLIRARIVEASSHTLFGEKIENVF